MFIVAKSEVYHFVISDRNTLSELLLYVHCQPLLTWVVSNFRIDGLNSLTGQKSYADIDWCEKAVFSPKHIRVFLSCNTYPCVRNNYSMARNILGKKFKTPTFSLNFHSAPLSNVLIQDCTCLHTEVTGHNLQLYTGGYIRTHVTSLCALGAK